MGHLLVFDNVQPMRIKNVLRLCSGLHKTKMVDCCSICASITRSLCGSVLDSLTKKILLICLGLPGLDTIQSTNEKTNILTFSMSSKVSISND